ncbi:MAG: carboxypeptidase-like regulatory domain-containing protein [Treponema succinifaciens]|uniref:carboxypeptidase-like regulatory domain-containing protein n=1 Tax=Treponema succinifaciens TaxID=167 RepID=UPI0023F42B8C|nr:carboxypeptidase-like regulatory domain-containing protein [Treponema succinifaciens]MDD6961348.1 carboxypeptidase-like regulatory domain-containing protein [Treponema succinifaciens]MDY5117307.1 carboxypeptidase-like regulatory domain-containing protein [Treponema succinifaciens]
MNTKKLALALFPLLLAFASCMNMNGSSGKEGAIRITLPESGSRGTYTLSKDNPLYEVSLMQGDKTLKTLSSESTGGGDFVFDELEPGTYKIVVTARQQDGTFLARNSAEVEVTAGETQNCPITLILAGNKGKVFSSNYYVLREPSGSSSSAEFFDNISSSTTISSMNPDDAFEDIDGNKYYININDVSNPSTGLAFDIFKNNTDTSDYTITIDGASKKFADSLYYDPVNNSLWIGAMSSSNEYFFAKDINKLEYNETFSNKTEIPTYYPGEITAFAASGTELYIAYTNNGTSYLQRAKIEGENDSFTITTIGNPQSTQDMGVDGQITDIVIHYDGYVYVLVSQMGYSYTSGFSQNSFSLTPGDINYSRGAIVRLEPTSNGFKVSAKTGWTENYRTVYTKGTDPHPNSTFETNIKKLEEFRETKVGLKLYIPKYSERNSYFYGPRRFVAIKPKELAIADSGANIMLPEYPKTGGFFKHNRVVNVNLYKFAIESNSIIDLNNILFAPIYTLTDVGFTSQGYTYASSKEADE